jgi:dihydropteroate synthase
MGYVLLVGISRKSVIANILSRHASLPLQPDEMEEANIALNAYLASQGADIIRVHDVKKHYRAFKVLDKVLYK